MLSLLRLCLALEILRNILQWDINPSPSVSLFPLHCGSVSSALQSTQLWDGCIRTRVRLLIFCHRSWLFEYLAENSLLSILLLFFVSQWRGETPTRGTARTRDNNGSRNWREESSPLSPIQAITRLATATSSQSQGTNISRWRVDSLNFYNY